MSRRSSAPPTVLLCHCADYEPGKIREIVGESIRALGLKPRGRVLLKPNLVMAGDLFQHAHTRPEVAQGVVQALQDIIAETNAAVDELAIGERCAITVPSRYVFEQSGFDRVIERTKVTRHLFDEVPQVEIPLRHEHRLRDSIFVPEPVARADFFVNMPKFKAHPWTTVTFGAKNYIGIQDDRHRLIDHDYALDRKVADLQHVVQPQLLVIDAVTAGQGRMLTPSPFPLNLLVIGNNQVAVDATCCRILGIDPRDVPHIRLCHEDGFGPLDESEIQIGGDVPLGEARERARGFEVGLVRVEKYFEGSKISAYAGPAPGSPYCWGGCPGALEEAIEVLRLFDEDCDQKMRRLHVVFGAYKGPIDVNYGEKVVFVGDCVDYEGRVGSELIRVENLYRDRSQLDPTEAKHQDIYGKMIKVLTQVESHASSPTLRLEGCPVSVAELILALSMLGGVNNPYLSPDEVVRYNKHYATWRLKQFANRLQGKPYLVRGFDQRGDARGN